MDPREMLADNVELVRDVIRSVAFRHRLPPSALDDLESAVWIRLVEHDYRALRQYRGEASFRTFLSVVVARLVLDLRAAHWGRWRPSAQARRLGREAVRFEALVFRDGFSVDQALEILRSRGEALAPDAVSALSESLRSAPRRFVSIEEAPEPPASVEAPELPVERVNRARQTREVASALRDAVRTLSPDDRRLLHLRHGKGLKVATIAKVLKQDQMRLYRKLNGLHRTLRRYIERAGVTGDDVRAVLGA